MTAAPSLSHARREPLFPRRLLNEQGWFALICWVGVTVFAFLLPLVISFFRPIEISTWEIASQGVGWFGFAIGIYLGWTVLQLHVTHGGTRRGFFIQTLGFVAAYGLLIAALTTVSYLLEAGYYGLLGWTQAMERPALYASAVDVPMMLVQKLLLFWLLLLGGVLFGTGWYRSAALGALMIPIGLLALGFSSISLTGEPGPFRWASSLIPLQQGLPWALVTHLVLYCIFIGLIWVLVRDVPIRSKAAAS